MYAIKRSLTKEERDIFSDLSDNTAHLLFHRGIDTREKAHEFLIPDYDRGIHDPFLLKDAEKSAERILKAIKNNEKIAIYADYDADGIPGAAMFSDFLKKIGYVNFTVYIPHRHNEGFGFHLNASKSLIENDVKLIITIDCGISDVSTVEHCMNAGVDVIITDHHEPPVILPPAFAIIDHKQKDCGYPDKNLCGTGVAYKLIQAILKKNRFGLKEGHEKWFLDLVGISTLSDMVPLVGENRILAHYGLKVLRKTPRKGLRKLFDLLRINTAYISEEDISFMITPRINAASRMGISMDAFKLLSAENDDEAILLAEHLDGINQERKGIVSSMVKEAKKNIKERFGKDVPAVIVMGNPSWRPSLLGLVANSCAEEYHRPSFFWGRDGDDVIKGSCRSDGITNVVELMRAVSAETFTHYGGHHHSGGFAVHNDHIHFLEERLNKAYNNLSQEYKDPNYATTEEIDREITLNDINNTLMDEISRIGPFGTGNPKPIFLFRNIIVNEIKKFGKSGDHIELMFRNDNGLPIKAISFFSGDKEWSSVVKNGTKIDLIASLEFSYFRNKKELRLRVSDVIYK